MTHLNSDTVLKKLRKFIKKTQLVSELGESTNNYSRSKELIKNLDNLHSIVDKLQFVSSRRSGIAAKLNNKLINKIYWVIKNTINPVIDTQQRFNKNIIEILKSFQINFKTQNKEIKTLKKDINSIKKEIHKTNLYELMDYHGFENENRGNEEGLLDIQSPYLEYFKGKSDVLDIGCGRGEFLTLLESNGVSAKGIELNAEFVDYCQSKGLNVEAAEALSYLKSAPDSSIGGIIALQVVEHLEPDYLIQMISLAYKKMKRNSYIVLETLNPQSLIIFSASYYKDLSHIQPIHPATLLFLCKSIGFQGCEVKYSAPIAEKDLLQTLPDTEENKLQNENISKLNNLLFGSQNYAIIGKKI